MADLLRQLPLVPVGLLAAAAIAFVSAPALARRLASTRAVAWLLVLAIGLIVSATLTPLGGVLGADGEGAGCDLRRLTPPSFEALWGHDVWLNILLFVPLGFAIALVPLPARRRLIVAGALFPIGIEALQLVAPALGRGCQSADVVDNVIGLGVGLALGWLAFRTLGARRL